LNKALHDIGNQAVKKARNLLIDTCLLFRSAVSFLL